MVILWVVASWARFAWCCAGLALVRSMPDDCCVVILRRDCTLVTCAAGADCWQPAPILGSLAWCVLQVCARHPAPIAPAVVVVHGRSSPARQLQAVAILFAAVLDGDPAAIVPRRRCPLPVDNSPCAPEAVDNKVLPGVSPRG